MKSRSLPGLNIQWPWTRLILEGSKTVETRGYALPEKYVNVPLAIIETPGPKGKQFGIAQARIVGTVTFSSSFRYETFEDWAEDFDRHKVAVDNPQYKFVEGQEKWGWVIASVEVLRIERPAPAKRGIVFANDCQI